VASDPRFGSRDDRRDVELGEQFAPRFDDNGLIPVVAIDHQTQEPLMVAYMNGEALARTIETGEAVYFSRSRGKLWHKGETSGMTQKVHEMLTDCDQDVIVLKVEQVGGACCHNGYRSCFYRRVITDKADPSRPLPLAYTQRDRVFDPDEVYGKSGG
jgi:phosphoribosyl-AMP cyclohydrolase